MPGPLHGVRVLDLTSVISGPSATLVLADQGADVIKVENPNGGDQTRFANTTRNGYSASFLNNNRNKRSITIDLKSEEGVEVVRELAKSCDVFAQNFRPGVVDRIGVGEADIRAVKPDIIYVSISGFGKAGPYAHKPVYDPIVQALSGLTTVQAGSDEERPRLVRTILPDKLTGVQASQAITAALFHRERTGEGQHVELSMLDTVVSFLWGSDMSGHTFVGNECEKETAQSFIDLVYETKTGFITAAVQNEKQWQGLCRAFDKPEWLEDPRFSTVTLRMENIDERLNLTQEVLLTNTAEHWLKVLEENDVPCAPVLTRREAIKHPQIVASGIVQNYDHPQAGELRQTRGAATFSKTTPEYRHPAPVYGGNSRDILLEAGFSEDRIEGLIGDNVVFQGEDK